MTKCLMRTALISISTICLTATVGVGAASAAPTPPPSAPQNLTASRTGSGQVQLNWTAPATLHGLAVDYYSVFQSSDDKTWNLEANTGTTSDTEECGIGATCYFQVTATTDAGGGPATPGVLVTNSPPSAPQNLTASRTGSGQVQLNWTAPATLHGLAVDYYSVFQSSDDKTWNLEANTGTTSDTEECGIGATCYFQVTATTDAGGGPATPGVLVTNSPPSAPQNLTASRTGSGQVQLNWTAPATLHGLAVDYYSVFQSSDDKTWNLEANTGTTSDTEECGIGATCYFQVTATTDAGGGPATPGVLVTNSPPSAPQNLTASRTGSGQVQLNWTAPATLHGLAVDYYSVFQSSDDKTWNLEANTGGGGPSQGTYVALGDSYSSGNGAPTGDPPSYMPGTNTSTDGCHRSLAAYPEVAASVPIQIVFKACSGSVVSDFYGPNHKYPVGEPFGQLHWVNHQTSLVSVGIGGNNIGFADVMQCFTYPHTSNYCEKDKIGEINTGLSQLAGPSSSQDSLRHLYLAIKKAGPDAKVLAISYPRIFPSDPTSPCGTGAFHTHFSVADQKWLNTQESRLDAVIQAAANAVPGVVFVDESNALNNHELCTSDPWVNHALDSATAYHPKVAGQAAMASIMSATIRNDVGSDTEECGIGATCYFQVTATTDAGGGPATPGVLVTNSPPSAPQNLTASRTGSGQVQLNWTAPATLHGLAVDYYSVFQSSDDKTWNLEANTGTTSDTEECGIGATCYFQVTATTDAGGGPATPGVLVTNSPPSAPQNLTASRTGSGQVQLNWTAPATLHGLAVDYYSVFQSSDDKTWNLEANTGTTSDTEECGIGATCYFQVTATTDAGGGPSSNSASV